MRIGQIITSLAQIVTRDHDLLSGLGDDDHPQYVLAAVYPLPVRKTADETVNNSTVLQNDDHLFFAMAANEVWEFVLLIIHNSSAVADFKAQISMPAAGVMRGLLSRYSPTNIWDGFPVTEAMDMASGGQAADRVAFILQGIAINGANAGNFQVQWAQNTAEVSNTIVRTNSCILRRKVA